VPDRKLTDVGYLFTTPRKSRGDETQGSGVLLKAKKL
jgi:hypothetical protein